MLRGLDKASLNNIKVLAMAAVLSIGNLTDKVALLDI